MGLTKLLKIVGVAYITWHVTHNYRGFFIYVGMYISMVMYNYLIK